MKGFALYTSLTDHAYCPYFCIKVFMPPRKHLNPVTVLCEQSLTDRVLRLSLYILQPSTLLCLGCVLLFGGRLKLTWLLQVTCLGKLRLLDVWKYR